MKKILAFIWGAAFSCQSPPPHGSKTSSQAPEDTGVAVQMLLYISDKDTGFNMYKNTLDGDSEEAFTQGPGWEWYPQYVSSQDIIVHNVQDTLDNFSLQAKDLAGKPLPFETGGLPGFEIAPDGDHVAYTRKVDDSTHIVITRLSASQDSLHITPIGLYNGRPHWSPQSDQVAFISDRGGSNELYIYDLKSQKTRQLTQNALREKYMSWSPQGDQIAFTMQSDSTENDIFVIDLASGKVSQLTDTPIHESEIAWSPLGDYMAYHAQVEGKDDIYVLEIASGEVRQISAGEGYYGEPEWFLLK